MTVTLLQMRQKALSLIGEASDTHAGELTTADNATIVQNTATLLTEYFNDGQQDISTTCYPVWGTGTVSVVTGQSSVLFSSLTMTPAGCKMWRVTANGVVLGSTPLRRATPHYADTNYPTRPSDPNGAVVVWVARAATGIALAPKANGNGPLTILGLVVPKPLVVTTDDATPVSWLNDEDTWVLAEYMAARLCDKNVADGVLSASSDRHWARYQEGREYLFGKAVKADPGVVDYFAMPVAEPRASAEAV